MIRVSVVGATGYTGGELLRLLLRHPEVVVTHVTSETFRGQPVAAVHRFLRGRMGHVCGPLNIPRLARDSDVVFVCLPHGSAARTTAAFVRAGTRVIDLSADFRLRSAQVYKTWYKSRHPVPGLLSRAVYGLPEIHREAIRNATLVANPGCYPTASILALWPLAKARLLDPASIILDAKSGISGAGRKLEMPYLFSEANENLCAYAVGCHRHAPEIEQELARPVFFVPHLVPMTRGILVTAYVNLTRAVPIEKIHSLYLQAYALEPFVTLLSPGESPETRAVQRSNFCHIGIFPAPKPPRRGPLTAEAAPGPHERMRSRDRFQFAVEAASGPHERMRSRRLVVLAAIDNLMKGASGQAVQNMNLLFGLQETTGLL